MKGGSKPLVGIIIYLPNIWDEESAPVPPWKSEKVHLLLTFQSLDCTNVVRIDPRGIHSITNLIRLEIEVRLVHDRVSKPKAKNVSTGQGEESAVCIEKYVMGTSFVRLAWVRTLHNFKSVTHIYPANLSEVDNPVQDFWRQVHLMVLQVGTSNNPSVTSR